MTADLMISSTGVPSQEFIGTKRSAGSMRSSPVVFGFYDLDAFVSFFVGEFIRAI